MAHQDGKYSRRGTIFVPLYMQAEHLAEQAAPLMLPQLRHYISSLLFTSMLCEFLSTLGSAANAEETARTEWLYQCIQVLSFHGHQYGCIAGQ